MPKNKIAWKERCLAAEKCAELLRIEKGSFQDELANRPAIEKIVERKGPCPFDKVLAFIWLIAIIGWCWMYAKLDKLQTPILQPYPVQVDSPQPNIETSGTINILDKLTACQDSWREDEAKIKKLRRECR